MAFPQRGSPFLYDEVSRRIVGVNNPDGGRCIGMQITYAAVTPQNGGAA